jgi:alkanesulfonate monooxygenase SsuD/methylene tetrahydromethanopterin reductase-like flavin-dependent oxidoreductase (luciferase family)
MTVRQKGIYLEALPPDELVHYAREADRRGFDSAWFSEIIFTDAFTPATAAALQTTRLKLGAGVVGLCGRSPVVMALTAASCATQQGTIDPGPGTRARSYVTNWHGRNYGKPLLAMREYLTLMKSILHGQNANFDGEIFRVSNFQLPFPVGHAVPIYVGAIGPKMIELAGELADGVMGAIWSLPYIKDVVIPNLKAGADRAGRDVGEVDITLVIPTLVTDDDRSLHLQRGQVMQFASAEKSSPFYRDNVIAGGFEQEYTAMMANIAKRDYAGALECVTDEMVDALTLTGTVAHIRKRMAEILLPA